MKKTRSSSASLRNSSGSPSTSTGAGDSPPPHKSRRKEVEQKYEKVAPLNSLLLDRALLARTAFDCLPKEVVDKFKPKCLKDSSNNQIIDRISEELDGMSKKRILAALEGHDLSSSSEDSDECSDNEKDEEDVKEVEDKQGNGEGQQSENQKKYSQYDRVSVTVTRTPPPCDLTKERTPEPVARPEEDNFFDDVEFIP